MSTKLEREYARGDRLEAELATLKREHEQLRAAAERAEATLAWNEIWWTATSVTGQKDAIRVVCELLRAALDATPAEPGRETFDPDAMRAIQAALQFSDRLPEFVVQQLGDVIRAKIQAERQGSDAYTALRAFAERASRMTSAEWTPEVRHELGRILDLGRK